MADSFIQIDPDSTGKSIDTRTIVGGDHRQVIAVGDDGTSDEVARVDAANGLDVDVTRLPSGSLAAAAPTTITKDYDTGGGTDNVLIAGIALPGAGGSVAGGTSTNPVRVDPTGTTIQPVSGTVTANAGTGTMTTSDTATKADDAAFTPAVDRVMAVGFVADETGTDAIDEGDIGAPRIDVNRRVLTRIVGATDANRADVDASGHLQVDIAASSATVTVSATNLDIRDLVAASDAVSVHGDVGVLDQLDLTNSNPAVVAIVDGNGDQITSFGGGTQYTEDAAAAANPVGTALNLIRADALAGVTSTDGDNVAARGTDKGELYVKHVDTIAATQSGTWNVNNIGGTVSLPTGASTLAEQQSQTTHLATIAGDTTNIETSVQLIDDTVATLGTTTYTEAATKGLVISAIRRDADTTLVDTTNEAAPLQVDANGRLKVEAFSGETLPVSLTSTTITGSVAVTQSGVWDEVGINDSGNSITVDNGGTFAVQVDGSALTALQLIDDPVATLGTTTYTETATKGNIIGAVRRDADTSAVNTDNEIAPLLVDANGYLKVEIFDGGGSHTVDNNGTFATQATLQTGDNTVGRVKITDGTDVADVLDLANSNPITVAIVDGSGDQITSFGGGTQYTEDAAAAANPVGTVPMLVRADTPAGVVTTDGDNVAQRGTNFGAAYVQVLNSSGSFINSFGGSGGTAFNDDAAFTVASDQGTPIMGLCDETATDSVDEGDVGVVRMTADRVLRVQARGEAAGGGTLGNPIPVAGTNDGSTVRTLSMGLNDSDNVAAGGTYNVTTNAFSYVYDGTNWDRARGDATDGTLVNLGSNNDVTCTNAGTFAVQVDGNALTALQLIDDTVATLGTSTYTETTTKGNVMGAVRRDADTSAVNTDNEVAPLLVNAIGALKVEIFDGGDSHTVDGTVTAAQATAANLNATVVGTGTFAVQVDGAALTALQLIDDIVYTDDTSTHATGTSKGALIMAAATPTDAAVNANDIGAVGMTVNRELHVAVQTALPAGTNNIGDVDVLSIVPGTGATNLGKAEDGGHTTGDVGNFVLAVRNDTPNTALTNADADYIQVSAYRTGAIRTAIPEEDFAALGSNHVKKYYTNAGAVTDGIVWSPAAGKRWYVTDLMINVSAACTLTLEDDLAAGDSAVFKAEFAANSGVAHHFGTPLFSGEDAADLLVTTSAGNVYITVVGYEV